MYQHGTTSTSRSFDRFARVNLAIPQNSAHQALTRALGMMLHRIPQVRDQLTGVITAGDHGVVVDINGLTLAAGSPALQAPERALCLVVSHLLSTDQAPPEPLAKAWDELPATWQVLVSDALSLAAHERLVEHTAALQAQGMAVPAPLPSGGAAMRVKIGPPQIATADDGLGRSEIGYRPGLSPQETWDRGRGLWKLNADKAMQSDILLIAHEGVTVMVGAITGLQRVGNRLAVTGYPLPHHPLVNRPDPLHNTSRNPVTYGTISH